MTERSEKVIGEERFKILENAAKDPVSILKRNVGRKTCKECIQYLRDVRSELHIFLTQNPDRGIKNPNPFFKQFYKSGNGEAEHYIGMFTLLRDAGFARLDIEAALMDDEIIPLDPKISRGTLTREHIVVTQSALDHVFQENKDTT